MAVLTICLAFDQRVDQVDVGGVAGNGIDGFQHPGGTSAQVRRSAGSDADDIQPSAATATVTLAVFLFGNDQSPPVGRQQSCRFAYAFHSYVFFHHGRRGGHLCHLVEPVTGEHR
jgi:hypothetical protein